MRLTEIYQEGKKILRGKEFGWVLDAVETGFIPEHDRRILDRYTFRPQYIDGVEPKTTCRILDVELATPVIMSAMTMPIPAITDNGLMDVAQALKDAGSLMWVGTPIPKNLEAIGATGVPLVANAKPFRDRDKVFRDLEEIQKAGVTWVGIETDAGQGTKIHDKQVASDCAPLSLQELKDIRKKVSCPLICKGILSRRDAEKCVEAGADGIHPIDPSAGMDIGEAKTKYGDRICLMGNIDCVRLLSWGSEEEVRETVRTCIRKAGKGGGLICMSSNSIHSGVKPANYSAMVKAIKEYGQYPLQLD